MKLELLKSAFLGGLVMVSLIAATLNTSADAANTGQSSAIKTMSPTQFYELVKQTQPNQVATNFGKPDEMITLKSANGDAKGIVWVYHKIVVAQKTLRDARFVLINGEMKYVTLSGAA